MMAILHILDWLPVVVLAGFLVGLRWVIRRYRVRGNNATLFIYAMVALLSLVVTAVFSLEAGKAIARSRVKKELQSIAQGEFELYVNGISVEAPADIVALIHELESHDSHHSHPTDHRYEIRIASNRSESELNLILRRDSDQKHEYWVFWPEFSEKREIGSIRTQSLATVR